MRRLKQKTAAFPLSGFLRQSFFLNCKLFQGDKKTIFHVLIIKISLFSVFIDFFVIIFKKYWTKELFMLHYTLDYCAF